MHQLPPLSVPERLKKSVKWFVAWGAMTVYFAPGFQSELPSIFTFAVICLTFYAGVYRMFFGCFDDFLESLHFSFLPDIVSAVFGELSRDLRASIKLAVAVGICCVQTTLQHQWYVVAYEVSPI